MIKAQEIWKPFPGSQERFLSCPVWEVLLHGNRGGGKSQPLHCKILTPKGWHTMGDMKLGSRICNPDGTTSTVIGIFPQGILPTYKITFADGGHTYCSDDHLWYAKIANRIKGNQKYEYTPLGFKKGKIFTTRQLRELMLLYPNKRPIIPVPKEIKFTHQDTFEYKIDPYLLGLLLGDGGFSVDYRIGFTSIDSELIDYVKQFSFEKLKCETISYRAKTGSEIYKNIQKAGLLGLKSHEKFVPKRYLFGTKEERLALLQGLMDTDGYVAEQGTSGIFTSVSKRLIQDVRFLVHSLGGRVSVNSKIGSYKDKNGKLIKCRKFWNIRIVVSNIGDLFRLKRKNLRGEGKTYQHNYIGRKIVSISLSKIEPCQCIKINNPNGLYITDDFIVTHNTDVLLMDFLQGVGVGYGIDYKGLILREATTELGDIITKSKKWIPRIFPTAKFNNQKKQWSFDDGETLWFNYARVEDDYEQYHGHCKVLKSLVKLPNNKFKQAGDIKVGDLVQTLQGVKKITKIYKHKKVGVKVSVYDTCSNLIGEQYQGVLHPVLTNAGWQRVGLALLSCTSLQSSILEPLIAEVQEFLTEIHQEIFQASLRLALNPLDFATSKHLPVLYSYLNQISGQFSDMKRPVFSIPESLFYVSQEILWELFLQTYEKTFGILFHNGLQNVQQFLFYCDFLQILVLHVREVHVGLLNSILCYIGYEVFSRKQLVDCFLSQKNIQRQSNPLQPLLVSLIIQVYTYVESSWHDTLKYVQIVKNKGQDYQDHCCSDFYPNDGQPLRLLGIVESFFPLQNDVQEYNHEENISDDQVNKRMVFQDKFCGEILHPYCHTPLQTDFPLTELSFSISSLDSPIEMVDFEVQDVNHYITVLDTVNINNTKQNIVNSQEKLQVQLIDQNSYSFIGWEEITNHALPNVYLKMMSCNRTSVAGIPLKYRATCNPSGPGHQWVKERFIDKSPPEKVFIDEFNQTRTHIQSNLLENKALLEADPQYQAKLLAMTQDNKMLRDAWVFGSWDLISGGFFTDVWDKRIHVLESFKVPRSWSLFRSFDWGSSKPWSVTYGVEANGEQPQAIKGKRIPFIPRGSVIIITEIYGWNGIANEGDKATSQEIAERILNVDYSLGLEYKLRVTPGPADTSIWEVRDGTSIAANLNTHGCRWVKAYKGSGSRIAGWALIRQMLGAAKRGDLETPHLYFFEQAQHHIRTLPVMQRDKKKPEDIDSELEDHCMDSLRYLLTRKMLKFKRKKVGY